MAWLRRQPRWKRLVVGVILGFVVGVGVNLLLTLAMRDWRWHPSVLTNAAFVSLGGVAAILVIAWWAERARRKDHSGRIDQADVPNPGA